MQSDGKIIVGGGSADYSGHHFWDLTLARYLYFPPASTKQIATQIVDPLLYPNPTSGKLMISNTNHIIDITAYDILGNKIPIIVDLPNKEIQTNNLASSIYSFTLSFDDRPPIVQKVLIQSK